VSAVRSDAGDLLAHCTFPPAGSPLTCAVSGGADSLALLVLAVAAGCRVTAVHVDHGLRAGSDVEAQLVAAAAGRLGAAFRAERVTVLPGPNLEARARAARFAVLPPDVATGHTMDDQAETVLCNLLRGCGPDGLAAMRPGPAHPLLGLRRSETQALRRAEGLDPFADPSNDDLGFLRNRVRHELLPRCAEAAGRDPVPLLARLAELAAQDAAFLDALSASAVPDPTDAAALAAAPEPLASRTVRRWLQATEATTPATGRRDPMHRDLPHHYPPSLADVRRVLAVARGAAVGTELTGGWRVRRTAGRLRVESPDAGTAAPATAAPPATAPATVAPPATAPATASPPATAPATASPPTAGDHEGCARSLPSGGASAPSH
jgi:tRNA(Ile)-lysidine synthase